MKYNCILQWHILNDTNLVNLLNLKKKKEELLWLNCYGYMARPARKRRMMSPNKSQQ